MDQILPSETIRLTMRSSRSYFFGGALPDGIAPPNAEIDSGAGYSALVL